MAFPTETVFGIGVDATNGEDAVLEQYAQLLEERRRKAGITTSAGVVVFSSFIQGAYHARRPATLAFEA